MFDNGRKSSVKQEIEKYNKYSHDIRWLLKASGVWPTSHTVIQYFKAFLALMTVSLTFLGAVNFSLSNISNIIVFTRSIGLVISLLSTIIKIGIFLYRRNDIIQLNSFLTDLYDEDLKSKRFQHLALAYRREFAKLFYILTATVGMTSLVTSLIIPLLALRQGKYVPIIPSIFPFFIEPGSYIYWLIQLINIIAAFFVWTVTCGVDSVFGMYTLQMCGELKILAYKFKILGVTENYKIDFEECMRRHRLLMKCKHIMEKVFGFLSIWLAITSAITQCTLVFQATQILESMNPMKMIFIATFLILKVVQAFMYAWYGNLITEESELCLNAIYNASWPGSGNKKFMNDVYIILLQRPFIFTAKGWMYLKMELFAKIIQTSVSYFFLLRTLNEDSH